MQVIYIFLCIAGAILPLSQFIPWLIEHNLNVPLLLQQAVSSPISAFAWADVLVSGMVVAVFIVAEARRLAIRHWWLALISLVIGPSLALPVFLLLRERHLVTAMPHTAGTR